MRSNTLRPTGASALRSCLWVAALLMGTVGCSSDSPTANPSPDDPFVREDSNEVILAWSSVAHDAVMAHDGYGNGLEAVRVFAMMHAAQHDALNAIHPAYKTYTYHGTDADADPVAAAAAAAHGILYDRFPAQAEALDRALETSLEGVPDGAARARGVELGRAAADAVLQDRTGDGSDTPVVGDYTPAAGTGRYQFTPPFDFAFLPGWRSLRPFTLERPDQFRTPPPPTLTSEIYARDLNEVKAMGRKDGALRTPEQGAYALFWDEFSDMGWNRIGRIVAAEQELGLWETARLFTLLNMVMSDAYVAGWDSKYHHDFWRPQTAIQAAGEDGNPATAPDPEWESLVLTPPVQDHPSTHSALGNAAAAVLASVFGDETSFSFSSTTADPAYPTRSFSSFSQAADENADSRVMGGLHFRFACDAGQELGSRIGEWALQNTLRSR